MYPRQQGSITGARDALHGGPETGSRAGPGISAAKDDGAEAREPEVAAGVREPGKAARLRRGRRECGNARRLLEGQRGEGLDVERRLRALEGRLAGELDIDAIVAGESSRARRPG